ncbi:YaeQ family protein [Aestuariibacter sp. A3R04]|uniref:YaeQ family protein n=1 Tax=Aestuariibacter sp. A3R04 TaxID=2841571 RepID=UPI001C0A043C|nr:YaeQ family protein [Aestuariibacter sp. A3R04]MBU3020508.1 YaeQ family protein [Aestuariibacter sp. A3R04]
MALKATIFKADLSITDMDRNYYNDHNLTIARHPSENDERMMLRIIAFIANAHERLQFTKGLSDDDVPDLWLKSYSDDIELWIELGQPSDQRIKKGCNQSQHMMVYAYADNSFDVWWKKEANKLQTRKNLSVFTLPEHLAASLAGAVQRSMQIQVTIQDGQMWLTIEGPETTESVEISIEKRLQ